MSAARAAAADFEALDVCHQQMLGHLGELAALARHIEAQGIDAAVEKQARKIEAFFSDTSRQHHVDEELSVFPPLLASGNADLVDAVKTLKQDHGWIEQDWLELAPQLRAIADGNHWVEPAEFQHAVEVFVNLCEGHIALEETLIYPESKARWAQTLARRAQAEGR